MKIKNKEKHYKGTIAGYKIYKARKVSIREEEYEENPLVSLHSKMSADRLFSTKAYGSKC